MRCILLSLLFLLLPLLFALPAVAGNWGENWGTLTWGSAIAAVPTMGKLGVLVLALGLGGQPDSSSGAEPLRAFL